MKQSLVYLIAICLILPALGIPRQVVQAQSDNLTIGLLYPNEGETFYANPLTFIYSFKIRGWVESTSHPAEDIVVEVKILQDGRLVNSKQVMADEDGLFSLPITVNPNADPGSFTQFQTACRIDCHYTTDFQLPEGPVTLEVTAIAPGGNQASLVRHIQVDIAEFLNLPVEVVLEGNTAGSPGDIPVSASTRLYMWRARNAMSFTDQQGRAELKLEALSLVETRYLFRVEPVIMDGVYYENVQPVEVILPPGASSAPMVTIHVLAKRGEIKGLITMPDGSPAASLEILIIQIPEGPSTKITTGLDGTFSIKDLSVGTYLLTADPELSAQKGFAFPETGLDLRTVLEQELSIQLDEIQGRVWRGRITDNLGRALPFAWISPQNIDQFFRNRPGDGSFVLTDIPSYVETLMVAVPGYYTQSQDVDFSAEPHTLGFALNRRPDTISEPWGDGEIVVPAESDVDSEENKIRLISGWVWGYNETSAPQTIQLLDKTISLSQGQFALEFIPSNKQGWLYVFDGKIEVSGNNSSENIVILPGEMVVLIEGRAPQPIPYDPVIQSVLRETETMPVRVVREPTLSERIRDQVNKAGVGAAQVLTLITYVSILVSIILVPLFGIYWTIRRRRKG